MLQNAKEKKPDVDKTKRTKKRKFKEKKHTEDECFRCGDGGDLVLCDVTKCPKGYHLSCLNLNKLPGGKCVFSSLVCKTVSVHSYAAFVNRFLFGLLLSLVSSFCHYLFLSPSLSRNAAFFFYSITNLYVFIRSLSDI